MKNYTISFLALLFLSFFEVQGQLKSGPMLGYLEYRDALVWIEVEKGTEQACISYWKEDDKKNSVESICQTPERKYGYYPINFELHNLEMNTSYVYELLIDGKKVTNPNFKFSTKKIWKWREDAPEVSFLFGSCAYINDSLYDRPGTPYGKDYVIYESMNKVPSDFTVWGGDNIYLREADWNNASGIYYRNSQARATKEFRELLFSRPNYAIWDDHDFGPNNSDRGYYLKDIALQAFNDYWGNQTAGHEDTKGIFTKTEWSDIEIFLMDDRYHRTPNWVEDQGGNGSANPYKEYFGKEQLQWLKDNLVSSQATFKIIINGNQMLNPMARYEVFRESPSEFDELIGFIDQERIKGVVFMSGDRHFTELIKVEGLTNYPLYDFTCSPLSSGPATRLYDSEKDNPYRVDGTLTQEQNFSKITIKGEKNNRILFIEVFDKTGKKLWDREFPQSDLGYSD